MLRKKILFLYFYDGSKITLSKSKYHIHSINVTQKNINFDNINGNLYDLIILGGVDVVHSGLPTASQIHNFIPRLYSFLETHKNSYILGICYGMQLLYHLYYRKQVKLLNNRNVSTQNVVLDQRYKISQNLGNCLCDVKFNHTYYCPCIDNGIISYILYDDGKKNPVNIPSFVKFNDNCYGIQFHIKNYNRLDKLVDTIIRL